jgi:hypothetical protein
MLFLCTSKEVEESSRSVTQICLHSRAIKSPEKQRSFAIAKLDAIQGIFQLYSLSLRPENYGEVQCIETGILPRVVSLTI